MSEKEMPDHNSPEHMEMMRKERIIQWKFWWRPPKYKTAEELEKVIDDYFESFNSEANVIKLVNKSQEEIGWDYRRLPSVTWLAIYLGHTSRQSLLDYWNRKDDKTEKFSDSIKRAKLFIENFTEERLLMWKWNATWLIFNLKNNFDWKDKTEVDNNHSWSLWLEMSQEEKDAKINALKDFN